ncbi:hypothetical protein N7510_006028 [Penicillium lagena]|uniref:uncharacterized protein n=1 Tax=Penicillium lagena TaxID=94218 RepID=UPI00254094C4|nr:uncharacterized protein N7510_006028 [Penicillium lagena]KAJ5612834.1 hypothetical protein N7510_006028 [Penicillium lagena]
MFKSCNYCRHRKKKCALDSPWASRCTECKHLDLVCEFSRRQPSLKRRQTSQRIASRVSAVAAASVPSPAEERRWANTGSIVSVVKDGDSQLNSAGVTHSDGQKIILKDDDPNIPDSTARKYWDYVHPLTPFVPSEMIQDDNESWDPVLHECVALAAGIWLHHRPDANLPQRASDSLALVTQGEMTLQCLAGALLMMLRFPVENDSVQRVFGTLHAALLIGEELPAPILAGAIVANTWLRLIGSPLTPLDIPDDFLKSYTQSVDPSTFAHHYLRISNLGLSLDRLRLAEEHEGLGPDAKLLWCRLEYECLFWAVQLPSSLLDLRDEMPARPEAITIHSLHNLVVLSFYATVLGRQNTLGKLLALRPVPGVLHYICSLVRSVFICPREMLIHWAILSDIQATTAHIILQLWRQTQFENFRGLLNLWDDALDRYPELAREVREEIGSGPWTIDQTDGYSVFWTFRDLRSLHLEDAVPQLAAETMSSPIPFVGYTYSAGQQSDSRT